MKKTNLIFQLLLFLTISSTYLFSASDTYVPDPEGTVTLLSISGYDSNANSSSRNDFVYYRFELEVAGDVTITVNDVDTTDVRFNYSTLDYPSVDWNNGFTTESLTDLAQNSYIYLAISSDQGNTAEKYQLVVTLTPTSDSNLTITKTNSADVITINEDFFYTINVKNISSNHANTITVTDVLPEGLIFNQTETNALSPYWDCSISNGTVTCDHNATGMGGGETHTISLQVTAPSDAGDIENNASVSGSITGTTHADIATETTIISADVDSAPHLCYIENTLSLYNDDEEARDAACEKTGNFYFGNGCTASVMIVDTNRSNEDLINVIITKMYAPDLDHGLATTSQGVLESTDSATGGASTLSIAQFPSYTEGYVVRNITGFVNDTNFTITDENTYNNGQGTLTPALYGDYNVSGVHHSGRIFTCSGIGEGGIEITSSSDVIDTNLTDSIMAGNYNSSSVPNPIPFDPNDGNIKYIQTMVALTASRDIVGVYLDINDEATGYTYLGIENPPLPYTIIPLWANSDCSVAYGNVEMPNGDQLLIEVPSGSYSAIAQIKVPLTVRKDARIHMTAVDPNGLSLDAQDCMSRSSTSGNFARIAQCANSTDHYTDAFGQDAWDRCGAGNGAPCLSTNGGFSDSDEDSYNPLYDNELGCYMCTFDIQPSCSTDNFAIRPDRFVGGITHSDAPHLLRAGKEYGTSLTATNPDNTVATSYSAANTNVFGTYTNKYFKSDWGNIAPINLIDPTVLLNDPNIMNGDSGFDPIGAPSMIAGLSHDTANSASDPDPIINLSYSDVGEVTFYVYDEEWAEVDDDDTPQDCNSTNHTYICSEQNLTFIPHHFRVDSIHLRNHRDGNFTYLSNDLNMSAHIDANISAMNANDDPTLAIDTSHITQNFRQGALYYENPVSVDLNVTEWNAAVLGLSTRHPKDVLVDNDHTHDIPPGTEPLGFGGPDANGVHSIAWNDTNETQKLMFNYKRQNNQTVNPFILDGTDVNVTVNSNYISAGVTAMITGSGVGDRNATFVFARAKTADINDFYDGISAASIITPATIIVYCDKWPASAVNCPGVDRINGQANINYWWLSTEHDMPASSHDGNITLTVVSGANLNDPVVSIDTSNNGVDNDIVVSNTGPASSIVDINLDTSSASSTSSWLIYNPSSSIGDPIPFYKVKFIGTSGWTGHGKTGHVVDSNASKKRNNRVGW
ncbi:MAG: DUF11 domain-containing protein [Sulfurovum sp.]|nr:DUF11 domain-containing protein [Sulfurovum sp.]